MKRNKRNEAMGRRDYMLPSVFLFSIFIHTELSAMFMGVSLRHLFVLATALCFLLYIKVRTYNSLYLCVIGSFVVLLCGNLLISEYYTDSRAVYSLLTYCIPFFFSNEFFSDLTERTVKLGFLVALLLLGLWYFAGLFRRWNDNIIAYLYFGGINLYLLIPMHYTKMRRPCFSDHVYLSLYLFGLYLMLQTNSRNVMLAQIAVFGMIFFRGIIQRRLVYKLVSCFAIAYPMISIFINEIILNNDALFAFLLRISYEWTGKNTVFDGRIYLQQRALDMISKHPILGYGHMPNNDGLATHNNYLQVHYEIGLIGTFLCAVFIYIILKKAWENFTVNEEDNVSYTFAAIIIGFLIQLGAESFLFGNDIVVLMPYYFMGVVLYRNRRMRNEYFTARQNMEESSG